MTTVAFFNNKGGVGKTSLVYHLAHMFSEQGVRTLAADLDPQANLSAMFLDEDRLAEVWKSNLTVTSAIQPLIQGIGDIAPAHSERITRRLSLAVGDLRLSALEDQLAESWGKCLGADERSFRVMSAFYRVIKAAATQLSAGIVLMDLGPNLGALNRAALIAADYLVVPLAPDLFSMQGLENLGPTLRKWRKDWRKRVDEAAEADISVDLPKGEMAPVGYVVMSFGVRDRRPVKAYDPWLTQIPLTYRNAVLGEDVDSAPALAQDPLCLASLKHYRSLMPMAMAAHKPMFALKTADGAIGAHQEAVQGCRRDFLSLAGQIGTAVGVTLAGEEG